MSLALPVAVDVDAKDRPCDDVHRRPADELAPPDPPPALRPPPQVVRHLSASAVDGREDLFEAAEAEARLPAAEVGQPVRVREGRVGKVVKVGNLHPRGQIGGQDYEPCLPAAVEDSEPERNLARVCVCTCVYVIYLLTQFYFYKTHNIIHFAVSHGCI